MLSIFPFKAIVSKRSSLLKVANTSAHVNSIITEGEAASWRHKRKTKMTHMMEAFIEMQRKLDDDFKLTHGSVTVRSWRCSATASAATVSIDVPDGAFPLCTAPQIHTTFLPTRIAFNFFAHFLFWLINS